MAAPRILIRDYQEEALTAIVGAERRGVRHQAVQLPTGTGKTIIFTELIRRRGGRSLVLVHRDELVQQAIEKLAMVAPQARVGVVKAERDDVDADVIVASVQTLAQPHRLARLESNFTTLIIDEAHHAAAPSYRRIVEALAGPETLLLGVSATLERSDGHALGSVFEEIVYERDILSMIEAGYLVDITAKQIELAADFESLHTRAGDFVDAEVEEALLNARAPEHVADAYVEHASGRKAITFTTTVRLAHDTASAFRDRGIRAEALDGTTPLDVRRGILERLHSGETTVVSNCAVLTEGFDSPSVEAIIIARPTKSRGLYTQMIGRGTRIYPGKRDLLVLDVVGATTRLDLMTAATLMGVEPGEIETKGALRAVSELREEEAHIAERGKLIARTVDLFARAKFAWTHDAGRFVLPAGDGVVVLADGPDGWSVRHVAREYRTIVVSGVDVGYAQGAAEDYVRGLGAQRLADRNAPWRSKPASDKQLTTLRRMRLPRHTNMTSGEASDTIAAGVARRSA